MPRWLQVDFSPVVQSEAEKTEAEVSTEQIYGLFNKTYLEANQSRQLKEYEVKRSEGTDVMHATLIENGSEIELVGEGRGVLEAFVEAMSKHTGKPFVIVDYNEHTLGSNEGSEAIAYVQISIGQQRVCGAGRSRDILGATLNALLNAVARAEQ